MVMTDSLEVRQAKLQDMLIHGEKAKCLAIETIGTPDEDSDTVLEESDGMDDDMMLPPTLNSSEFGDDPEEVDPNKREKNAETVARDTYYDENGILRTRIVSKVKNTKEPQKEFFDYSEITPEQEKHLKIRKYFSNAMIKFLYSLAVSYDYTDNNQKARIISAVLGDDFQELGTGTNRIAFIYGQYVYKIALDRRGIVDNFSEFKRSRETPQFLAKTYETNGIISVQEYVTTIDPDKFSEYRGHILMALKELSKYYIFGDMGYDPKNYCNIGYRDNGAVVILDCAYMHPRVGNEEAMICKCGGELAYNNTYTGFKCTRCGQRWDYIDVKRHLDQNIENLENRTLGGMKNLDDLDNPLLSDMVDQIVDEVSKKIVNDDKTSLTE